MIDRLKLTLVALLALAFPSRAADKVVRIALAVPLTGDTGTEGQGTRRALTMAIEEANAKHRFPFTLELKALDDRADPKEAVNVANLISSDPSVVAVIGGYNSGCTIPAAKVYARAGIPVMPAAATNPEVTAQQLRPDWSGPKVVFRIMPTDDVQGSYAADFAFNKLKLKQVAVIHDKTAYGQGLAEQFRQQFVKDGGKAQSFDGIAVGDKDFKALLTRIKDERPDGIYFGGLYTEAGLLLKQAKELGLRTKFISGDGSKTDSIYAISGDAVDGAYMSMVGIPVEYLPAAKTFIERYHKRWPSADTPIKPYDHFVYEAAQILFDAMDKVGADRAKLLETLPKTHYKGMLGMTSFDQKGDTLNRIITMTKANYKTHGFEPIR